MFVQRNVELTIPEKSWILEACNQEELQVVIKEAENRLEINYFGDYSLNDKMSFYAGAIELALVDAIVDKKDWFYIEQYANLLFAIQYGLINGRDNSKDELMRRVSMIIGTVFSSRDFVKPIYDHSTFDNTIPDDASWLEVVSRAFYNGIVVAFSPFSKIEDYNKALKEFDELLAVQDGRESTYLKALDKNLSWKTAKFELYAYYIGISATMATINYRQNKNRYDKDQAHRLYKNALIPTHHVTMMEFEPIVQYLISAFEYGFV